MDKYLQFQQLEKNYGKEGAAIIQDNCQITIAGGFAPTSDTAEIISKSLGSRTVMSGSVSKSKNDPSQSLQMIERPLMTADELKSMKKGNFIVMKTGTHPFISKLKLFFEWGIKFNAPEYKVEDNGAREVHYTSKEKIENKIKKMQTTMIHSQSDKAQTESVVNKIPIKTEVSVEGCQKEVEELEKRKNIKEKNNSNSQQTAE